MAAARRSNDLNHILRSPRRRCHCRRSPSAAARPSSIGSDRRCTPEEDAEEHDAAALPPEVVFEGIAGRLCSLVRSAHSVVGAMAWLSDRELLAALASCAGGVDLVVTNDKSNNRLAALYRELPARPGVAWPVRRLGPGSGRYRPFMHHKFLVGLDAAGRPLWCSTGSYNGTTHSRRSLENIVVLYDQTVAAAYLREHSALAQQAGTIPLLRKRRRT